MKIFGQTLNCCNCFGKVFDFFHNTKPCERQPEKAPIESVLVLVKNSSDLAENSVIKADSGSSQEPLIKGDSASSSKETTNIEKMETTEIYLIDTPSNHSIHCDVK